MGNENNHDSKNGLISILLLIMLTTGTLIDPLTSSRPYDPLNKKLLLLDEQNVDARLWQDPIGVTEQFLNNKKEAKNNDNRKYLPITGFINKIKQEINDETHLKVIAVSVFGSSYSEPVEYRHRYRYAVVSALGSSNYIAQDNEHIKYFNLNTDSSSKYYNHINTKITLPYEWYESESQLEKVLVIWLNEDRIPSGKYRDFINLLYQELKKSKLKDDQYSFSLIGPTNTPLLVELLDRDPIGENTNTFKIFSPGATISDDDLLERIKYDIDIDKECSEKIEDEKIQCKLNNRSIVRTIGQDKNLAKALLWELEQRGVNREILMKNSCEDQVVLISEQDSLYAKSLTWHFINNLKERCPLKDVKHLVKHFTYLRGLDGKLPDFDDSSKKSQNEKNTKEQKNLLTQLDDASPEHAEGRNQFDYLRRLVDTIERLDSAEGKRDRIKAIGIIGTDVYDKLLILHALKDSFRHKIFFTTDLDARFLHKDQSIWARNLVVASNFDLSLHPKLQGTVMPFRDSYQTSMYFATLLSLDLNNRNSLQMWQYRWLSPQVFEIGRTQAIHLASPTINDLDKWIEDPKTKLNKLRPNNGIGCGIDNVHACLTIEPDRNKQINWIEILCTVLILFFVIAYVSWGLLKIDWGKIIFFIFVTAILIAVLFYFLDKDNYPTHAFGEPFLFLEGISVWPNLIIRYVGIIIILFVTYYYIFRKNKDISAIEDKFELCKLRRSRSWWKAVKKGPFSYFPVEKKRHIIRLWLGYKKIIQYRESKGYLWILLVSVIFLLVTMYGFFGLGYLNFPARGDITLKSHYVLIALQFLILWGLVFWVAYEAIACKRFIEGIEIDQSKPNRTEWSLGKKAQQKAIIGLPERRLEPYLHFLLITKLIKSINQIIYLPFILMLLIAIGRSNIFDNLGFTPALIVVYTVASVYLIAVLYLLRNVAEKQCGAVLQYYEEYRMSLVAIAPIRLIKVDALLTEIRNTKQSTFAPFLQRPTLLALLLPGGGIGLTSIVEYLYN